jgi:hypothetical protein
MVQSQEADVCLYIRGAAIATSNPTDPPRARVCRTIAGPGADLSDSGGFDRTLAANGTAFAPSPVYARHLINEGAKIHDPRSHA